ncbi:PAS domain-containing protein, partial [Klebsiella pneumoniae]
RFLHKNGNIIWFKCTCKVVEKDSLGKPILMIGTYFDVTKSKKIESELQHTVDRLALATQTARVGIWDLDFTSGKISWDDTMFELYGITREKFSGTVLDWESSLHPDDL